MLRWPCLGSLVAASQVNHAVCEMQNILEFLCLRASSPQASLHRLSFRDLRQNQPTRQHGGLTPTQEVHAIPPGVPFLRGSWGCSTRLVSATLAQLQGLQNITF